ncbi:Hsp20/alpha crystallin family protein [Streptomyces sp. NPDC015127]|uniref:Hsp20/alpha crystallin family protein n=1 Tax=Streptomyces sp. NPDC015127 TaxID=3364939 RepID=UPI0036F5821A
MTLPIRRGGGAQERRPAWRDPFGDFEDMWSRMGRLLEQAAAPTAAGGGAWMPTAEEEEAEDTYIVRAELPGIPAENVDIEVEGDELSITGELSEETRGKVLSRRTGKFSYRTTLPAGADSDNIDADLTDGVLTVRIPRTQQEQRRKIEIGHRRLADEAPRPGRTAQPTQTAQQPGQNPPPPTGLPTREDFGTDEMGGIPE